MANKVKAYESRFGNEFCLVINGSETREDAYVIPFAAARRVFTESSLASDDRGRWIGTIRGSTLTLAPNGETLNVAPYHNAFQLLDSFTGVERDELPLPAPDSVEDALETKLHLESDLEGFLVGDLNQLEPGLKLFDAQGVRGRQLDAGAAGRIDILAVDAHGGFVVIEVKAGEADRQVCGQVQAYMGWVAEHVAKGRPVRGIVVAAALPRKRSWRLASFPHCPSRVTL